MEKKKAVSQMKVAPLDVHFLIQVEKLGNDEVSELPNSSANVGANSERDMKVAVCTAQSVLIVMNWSVQVFREVWVCAPSQTLKIFNRFFLSKNTLYNIAKLKSMALGPEKHHHTHKTSQKDLERLLSP